MPKHSVPKSVDEYIAAQPEALRPKLEQVRAAIRKAVPQAVEGIGYRMPGYKLNGKPMLYFAGFKEHYSLFAASGTFFTSLEDELRGYELRKGTVHFPLTKRVPVKLISRIAKLRAAGIAAATKKPLLSLRKDVSRPSRELSVCRTPSAASIRQTPPSLALERRVRALYTSPIPPSPQEVSFSNSWFGVGVEAPPKF